MKLTQKIFITILSSCLFYMIVMIFLQTTIYNGQMQVWKDFDPLKLDPTKYRFTFTSILLCLQDFDKYFSFTMDFINESFKAIGNNFLELVQSFTELDISDTTLFSVLLSLIKWLGSIIIFAISFVSAPISCAIGFTSFLFNLLTGTYNIPVADLPTYEVPNWEDVWDITFNVVSFLKTPFIARYMGV